MPQNGNAPIKDCGTGIKAIEIEGSTLNYSYITDNTITVRGNKFIGTNGILVDAPWPLIDWSLYSSNIQNRVGVLPLINGTAIPTSVASTAFLFVDTLDGDLKVMFEDGTTSTLGSSKK